MKSVIVAVVVAFVMVLPSVSAHAKAPFVELPVFSVSAVSQNQALKECEAFALILGMFAVGEEMGKPESYVVSQSEREMKKHNNPNAAVFAKVTPMLADLVYRNPQISADTWFGSELTACEITSHVKKVVIIDMSDVTKTAGIMP